MEPSCHRPLVPRVGRFEAEPQPQKRKRTSIACDPCREKKTRCDSIRPICTACQGRDSTCTYVTKDGNETRAAALKRENIGLREKNAAFEEVIDRLSSLPDNDRHAVLEKFKTAQNTDPFSLLDIIKGTVVSMQPSAQRAACSHLPSIQSQLEFDLHTRHFNAYPFLDLSTGGINSKATILEARIPAQAPLWPQRIVLQEQYDVWLGAMDISFWTAVPIDNEYAKGAISLYLEIDHPTIGMFDAELFVADLCSQKLDFCSPFLVSALLAFASQGYVTKDSSAASKSYEFEREAEALLRVEGQDCITTLSGLALLSYSHGAHGQSADGSSKYARQLLLMGQRMRFFGIPDPIAEIQNLSFRNQRAHSAAAWGGFNTIMLQSLFYVAAPTPYPPAIETPGQLTFAEVEISGDSLADQLHGSTAFLPSFCSLWVILSEVLSIYRDPGGLRARTLSFADSKYQKLLALSDGLPAQLLRHARTSSHALFFNIVYHTAILETYRPFVPLKAVSSSGRLNTSTSRAADIFAASVKQLKSLIIEYKSQHQSAVATVFWAGIGLLQVANAVLKDLESPDWRYYFLFCIRTFQHLYPAFPVSEGIVQGLLAMAIQGGAISSSEARLIMEEFRGDGNFHAAVVHVKGAFVVDLDLAIEDRQLADVETWVNKFDEMSIFSEFTEGVV